MTQNSIVEKLRQTLSNDIRREADVVYVLVECRKLLDDNKLVDSHFALKLYCHWALHVDLSGRDSTLPFLRRVDAFVGYALDDSNFAEQSRMFHEFGFLESFRQRLKLFFQSQGLPTQLCDDDDRWHSFLTLYAGVIEDGSLSCNAQPGDLNRISGITFRKGRTAPGSYLPFDMVWDIRLLDGRILAVTVRAFGGPSGDKMMFHSVSLR